MSDAVDIRSATAADVDLLRRMTYEAAYLPGADRPPFAEALGLWWNARLVDGWPRPGDAGVVGEDHGAGEAVGAAWYRCFAAAEITAPMADPSIPELVIAVVPGRRGAGTGSRLLAALMAHAWRAGVPALDLNVHPANVAALHVYRRAGFDVIGEHWGLWMRATAPGDTSRGAGAAST